MQSQMMVRTDLTVFFGGGEVNDLITSIMKFVVKEESQDVMAVMRHRQLTKICTSLAIHHLMCISYVKGMSSECLYEHVSMYMHGPSSVCLHAL
jgi:hypothetical protein